MPTIDVSLADLRKLAGSPLTLDEVRHRLELVKGEIKRGSTDEELRVELQDTNRPDLWCIEGVARQIRQRISKAPLPWKRCYGFLADPGPSKQEVQVDPSVEKVRPFVAAFLSSGWKVDDLGLKAFIQAQETLSRNFGRKRATVAIGIYDGARIAFPVRYEAVSLDDKKRAFVPLAPVELPKDVPAARWEQPWTPAEILRDHPTGQEFKAALSPPDRAPILVDAKDVVLSFPPILNSRALGRVTVGMDRLFVEVTGTVLDHVLLAANILAANLKDRGAAIEPVTTRYPFDTERGRAVVSPHPLPEKRKLDVPIERFAALLGEARLDEGEIARALEAYGLEVETHGKALRVEAPPYRMDYLHEVDAVEDFAMSRGYETFKPRMPEEFTVGRLADTTLLADRARDRMIGYGFEEAIANILTEERLVRGAMNLAGSSGFPPLHGGALVKIANVMNASYSCLRDWLVPSLLEVESRSAGAPYPHRIFEAGEVAVVDARAPRGSRTEQRLAALVAHETASFSEAQAFLNLLLTHLGIPREASGKGPSYALEPRAHPSFLPGRAAAVLLAGRAEPIGVIGELHPEVLAGERGYGIRVPCAAFEVSLDAVLEARR